MLPARLPLPRARARLTRPHLLRRKAAAAAAALEPAPDAPAPANKNRLRGPAVHVLPASGYHGVVVKSRNCYQAKTNFNGRLIFIGSFSTPEGAARAYDICQRRLEAESYRCDRSTFHYNFPSDAAAEAAVKLAEDVLKAAYDSGAAAAAMGCGAAGGGGVPPGGGKQIRPPGPPRLKACLSCGEMMPAKARQCRHCRTLPGAQGTAYRGVKPRYKLFRQKRPDDDAAADGEDAIEAGAAAALDASAAAAPEVTSWQSFFWNKGVNKYIGAFHTEVEAAAAYDEAARAAWSAEGPLTEEQRSRLNFQSPEQAAQKVAEVLAGVDLSARKAISRKRRRVPDAAAAERVVAPGEAAEAAAEVADAAAEGAPSPRKGEPKSRKPKQPKPKSPPRSIFDLLGF